ncbi:MAG TPA: transglutaminase domain-containing protein [Spirochaetota bacterium]|nr:transglutaminase domain-containing protein [Spirochaetota bacterium]
MYCKRLQIVFLVLLLFVPTGCQSQSPKTETLDAAKLVQARTSRPDALASSPQASRYRTGVPDPVAINVPASLENPVFSSPTAETLGAIVHHLTASTPDPYLKTKRIHDWITLHIAYDNDAFLHGKEGSQDPMVFLKTKRTTCGGFARLFKMMADQAGLEALTVTGVSRNYIGLARNTAAGHAWNAVRIDGIWHIIDATADNRGGFENDEFGEQKTYRDGSLFLSPAAKRISNLAHKPEEQFVTPSLSVSEFLSRPLLYDSILRYGMEPLPASLSKIRKIPEPVNGGRYLLNRDELLASGDTWTIDFTVPPDVDVDLLLEDQNKARHPLHTWTERVGGVTRCHFRPPRAGTWQASIRARYSDKQWPLQTIYVFNIRAERGGAILGPAVRILDAGQRLGIRPDKETALTSEGGVSLEVRHPESHTLTCFLYDSANKLVSSRVVTSHFPGVKRFFVSLPDDGTYWLGVWARDIRTPGQSTEQVLTIPLPDRKKSRDNALSPAGFWIGNQTPLTNGFRMGGSIVTRPDASGTWEVTCTAPPGEFVTSRLLDASGKVLYGMSSDTRQDNRWTSRFIASGPGRYTARLYRLLPGGSMSSIAQAVLEADRASPAYARAALMPLAQMERSGIRVLSHSISAASGQHTLVLSHPAWNAITASLKNASGGSVQGGVLFDHGETSTRIYCAAPTAGNWRLDVSAKTDRNASGSSMVLSAHLPAQPGKTVQPPPGSFLATARVFVERGLSLQHAGWNGKTWTIVLKNPRGADIFWYHFDKAKKLVRGGVNETQQNGKYTASCTPGPGSIGRLYLREGGKTYVIGQVRLADDSVL